MNTLGVDPGASGSMVLLNGEHIRYRLMSITLKDKWEFLRTIKRPVRAYIEEAPAAIFGAAKSSCSKLYGSYREMLALITAACIPYERVKASVWQRGLSIPRRKKGEGETAWKNRLKGEAQAVFPHVHVTLALADALLIAEYGQRSRVVV